MATKKIELEELQVGCVSSHFLDSGSFSLWTKAEEYAKEHKADKWAFYDTQEHWDYLDAYAAFVKKYAAGIDLYANVDTIGNPELTWRNQKYLEKTHGLTPVPVVHYRTDLEWLQFYMRKGYDLIALGGLVGSTKQEDCVAWLDRAFDIICDQPSRLPKHKIHGFGVTSYLLLLRYPWWSVDSTSWTKVGAYGGILVPHKRGGKFVFDVEPYLMKVSSSSPDTSKRGGHVLNLSKAEQKVIREWLDFIGIPFGKGKEGEDNIEEYGVINRHSERKAANLLFFEAMRNSLPDWPWPFRKNSGRRGFGLSV